MIKTTGRLKLIAGLFVYFYLAFPHMVYAYLDPGTGSYILQILLAGLLGASFLIKTFWKNIKAFFVNLFAKGQKSAKDVQN
ncbi:MAG: hypothetical protein ACE5NG_00895 [bacterium]